MTDAQIDGLFVQAQEIVGSVA